MLLGFTEHGYCNQKWVIMSGVALAIVIRNALLQLGRKRRGTAPAKYIKAASGLHRNILQQLEKMNLIEPDAENG